VSSDVVLNIWAPRAPIVGPPLAAASRI